MADTTKPRCLMIVLLLCRARAVRRAAKAAEHLAQTLKQTYTSMKPVRESRGMELDDDDDDAEPEYDDEDDEGSRNSDTVSLHDGTTSDSDGGSTTADEDGPVTFQQLFMRVMQHRKSVTCRLLAHYEEECRKAGVPFPRTGE